MNKSPRCEDGACEFVPALDSRQLLLERPADEVRYGRLWAEFELPKLLTRKDHNMESKQKQRHKM
jgi:hypothetical protein